MRFTLEISRVAGAVPPVAGRGEVGVIRGGPEELLGWLETQLGLGGRWLASFHRVAEYARWIDVAAVPELAPCVVADRWETAAALLRRRDALRIGGWDGGAIDCGPLEARAIAVIEAVGRRGEGEDCRPADRSAGGGTTNAIIAGDSERLDEIAAALDAGQVLPAHRVVLLEPTEDWPLRWRRLLHRLEIETPLSHSHAEGDDSTDQAARVPQRAAAGSSLRQLQQAVLTGQVTGIAPDPSLAWVSVSSETSAVEWVGALLLEELRNRGEDCRPEDNSAGRGESASKSMATVIVCADPQVRLRLEHRLAALRLPTAGVGVVADGAPVFQVLPLAIDVGRRRIAPGRLLDFLQLPIGPVPRRAARRLARALAQQPGFGSERWEEAWGEVCSTEADPDGSVRETLERWLRPLQERASHEATEADVEPASEDEALPIVAVLERCVWVAAWASDEACQLIAARPDRPPPLATALRSAAEQAEALAELLQTEMDDPRGVKHLCRNQLSQWIWATRAVGLELRPFECEVGAVRIVSSLAEVRETYDRLIWLGGAEDALPAFECSAHDVELLRRLGIELAPREKLQRARVGRQRDGFALARQSCVLVQMPTRDERPECSLWTHVEACLGAAEEHARAVSLREWIDGCATGGEGAQRAGRSAALSAGRSTTPSYLVARSASGGERPQPVRALWTIPPSPLPQMARSATEMSDHLACPLRWVLKRRARIAPAGNVRLPRERQLAGTFCHQVLRRTFEGGTIDCGPAEARRRVLAVFDERLGLDAAVLTGSAAAPARGRLREQLGRATERLIELLQAGQYTRAIFETSFDVPLGLAPADDEAGPDLMLERMPDLMHGGQAAEVMRGAIDCLASREDGREVVIDFKFGGDARCREAIRQGRAVQLAIYAYSRFRETGRYPAVAYLVLSTGQIYASPDSRPIGMPAAACERGPSIESVWQSLRQAIGDASRWVDGGERVPCRPLLPVSQWPPGADLVLDPPGRNSNDDHPQPCCRFCDYGTLCGRVSLE